jgi:hypothetical protein
VQRSLDRVERPGRQVVDRPDDRIDLALAQFVPTHPQVAVAQPGEELLEQMVRHHPQDRLNRKRA